MQNLNRNAEDNFKEKGWGGEIVKNWITCVDEWEENVVRF